ncbi:MAG: hypothetical protein ABI758_05130 [Candidatus Woesebacteria bacterium]
MESEQNFIHDEIIADQSLLIAIIAGEPIREIGLPLFLVLEIANQIRNSHNLPLYEIQLVVPSRNE